MAKGTSTPPWKEPGAAGTESPPAPLSPLSGSLPGRPRHLQAVRRGHPRATAPAAATRSASGEADLEAGTRLSAPGSGVAPARPHSPRKGAGGQAAPPHASSRRRQSPGHLGGRQEPIHPERLILISPEWC
ncbi:proline-rich proteoglycan 2-like [Calypte anna]|uniref:proline-rich proteoglycan 2-like n=1 Tax=Calypte anna TaxID=9244 RepID=UPI0011C38AA7|nr:proline-rich proteoglycan 2-like [Calypte anna]